MKTLPNLSENVLIADENNTAINQKRSVEMESGTFLEIFVFILSAINTLLHPAYFYFLLLLVLIPIHLRELHVNVFYRFDHFKFIRNK